MKHKTIRPSRSTFTRRDFLRRAALLAAGVVAGPLIVPGRVLGLDGQVAPSNRITIGFIGTGRQAVYANIPGFMAEPDAQIVALCDVDSWRLNNARNRVNEADAKNKRSGKSTGCAVFADWRELLARKDIDAVMISTPDHWHVPMAIAAAKAGKDIACEKPLTRSIAEGRQLVAAVAAAKRVFRTDTEFRANRTFFRAAEMVRNGQIGKLQRIITVTPTDSFLPMPPAMPVPKELNYEMWLGPAPQAAYTEKRVHTPQSPRSRPGWMCIRDYADGMLANWGAHLNDIAMWANNTERTGPVEVVGHGKYPPAGDLWNVINEFDVDFTFANGVHLICRNGTASLRFEGTAGWIQIRYPNAIETSPESLMEWKPGPNDRALTYKTSEKRDFLDAVKSRGQTQTDAEGGHRVSSLNHLALAAIDLGRKLKWNPDQETVIGDDAANQRLKPKPARAPWDV